MGVLGEAGQGQLRPIGALRALTMSMSITLRFLSCSPDLYPPQHEQHITGRNGCPNKSRKVSLS